MTAKRDAITGEPRADSGSGQAFVHRADPRALLLTTLAFVSVVVSFDRQELSALVPLAAYPVWLVTSSGVSLGTVVRKLLVASPFVLLMALPNVWLDRAVALSVGGVDVTGGMLTTLSILLRFVLTVSAAIALVAATGLPAICGGMRRMGVPAAMVAQLLLLDRYVTVITGEATRMIRARALRSANRPTGLLRAYGPLVGHLMLRTLDRTTRVHRAMRCRGFTGELPLRSAPRFRATDWLFLLATIALFAVARIIDLPEQLERLTWVLGAQQRSSLEAYGPSIHSWRAVT